jgi:hypothetical protein
MPTPNPKVVKPRVRIMPYGRAVDLISNDQREEPIYTFAYPDPGWGSRNNASPFIWAWLRMSAAVLLGVAVVGAIYVAF